MANPRRMRAFPGVVGLDLELDRIWTILSGRIGPENVDLDRLVSAIGAELEPGELRALKRFTLERLDLEPPSGQNVDALKLSMEASLRRQVFFSASSVFAGPLVEVRCGSGGALGITGGGSVPALAITMLPGSGARPIDVSNGAHLTTGGVWQNGSSRQLKERITPFCGIEALRVAERIPVYRWSYSAVPEERHIGPMAEDVHEFAHVGEERSLSPGDVSGIALAAVQELAAENRALRQRVEALERRFAHADDGEPGNSV